MSPNVSKDNILDVLKKQSKAKYGFICLNKLIDDSEIENLNLFANNNKVEFETEIYTKTGFLVQLGMHYYNKYNEDKDSKKVHSDPLEYMGYSMFENEIFRDLLLNFDIISKQEMINTFSDYCADLGISVYDYRDISEYNLDLYLTRRTPLLRTEAVFVRPGVELTDENYEELLLLIENASKVATWLVCVTTPFGVYKIGLERMIKDMEQHNVWLYVIDPIHIRIYGITKGKKSKDYDLDIRDTYMKQLPHDSIRSPSQVVKISKYAFNENESYKSSLFSLYEIMCEDSYSPFVMDRPEIESRKPKYRDSFKTLMVIDKIAGIPIMVFSGEKQKVEDGLVSGFLTAMDGFVSEIGGSDSLKEINYKGFYVQAAYAESIKIALFLSKPSDQVLQERLAFFIEYLERKWEKEIGKFRNTGETSIFDQEDFEQDSKRFLEI